jgi:hypothetical protein
MEIDELHEGIRPSLSKTEIRPTAEQQRLGAANRLGCLAAAARHMADDLDGEFPQAARYIQDTAAGFEHLSNLLRDPHLDDFATLAANLGRYQPAAVVAGVVLIGLGLTWLVKTSGVPADRNATDGPAAAHEAGPHGLH